MIIIKNNNGIQGFMFDPIQSFTKLLSNVNTAIAIISSTVNGYRLLLLQALKVGNLDLKMAFGKHILWLVFPQTPIN